MSELAQRLQRLEDLEAIRQLFIDYGHHLDQCDFPAYAGLFTDDAELLLGPLGRAQGRAAIERMMSERLAGKRGLTYHLIANPVIQLDGDRASSHVSWAVLARGEGGAPTMTALGHHADQLLRTPDGWRFRRREGHIDLPSRLPGS